MTEPDDDDAVRARHRGHPTYWSGRDEDAETYYDDGSAIEDEERPCVRCGLVADDQDAPDQCLGLIPDVRNACCGHGDPAYAYVQFWLTKFSTRTLRGEDALRWFAERGLGVL